MATWNYQANNWSSLSSGYVMDVPSADILTISMLDQHKTFMM